MDGKWRLSQAQIGGREGVNWKGAGDMVGKEQGEKDLTARNSKTGKDGQTLHHI